MGFAGEDVNVEEELKEQSKQYSSIEDTHSLTRYPDRIFEEKGNTVYKERIQEEKEHQQQEKETESKGGKDHGA